MMGKTTSFLIFLVCLIQGSVVHAQNERLARSLYEQKDFERAVLLYEELHNKTPQNPEFYEKYMGCLMELQDYKTAKKTCKHMAKSTGYPLIFIIDESWVHYTEDEESRRFEKLYRLILEKSQNNINISLRAAERYKLRGMKDQAIDILLQAEDLFGESSRLSNEIALLEIETGNRLKALERYLDMTVRQNASFDQLKRIFDTYITDSSDVVALRDLLMSKIRVYPHVTALGEWLQWTFVQLQDWDKAFVYTRSLDLRLRENGYRMFRLGYLCKSNGELQQALKCFDYCLKKGEDGYEYGTALGQWFDIKYQLLSNQNDSAEWAIFDEKISDYIQENSPANSAFPAAEIWAKRLLSKGYLDSSTGVLMAYAKGEYVHPEIKAKAKLSLSDVLIQSGDVYGSELWLTQVEKAFKDDKLGQKAKFKRAELSFYRGDYEWANMQLDVLKGATSQLISNDAMELSLCITDNLGIDSNYSALNLYSKARLYFRQQRFDSALRYAEKVVLDYPSHSLGDEVLLLKAKISEAQSNFQRAADLYQTLAESYPQDILADNALFARAQLLQYKLNQPEKAKEVYQKIILNHTQSLYIAQAREEFRKLRGF